MGKKKKEQIEGLAELQQRRKDIEAEIDKLKKDRVEVIRMIAEARKQGG